MAHPLSTPPNSFSTSQPVANVSTPRPQALPYWVSGLLSVAAFIASTAGFLIPDLFQRDNTALAGCARGTALVILTVALPVLIGCMILTKRGSLRAHLVWLGVLTYLFYNSVYFTFSASFNRFFLAFLVMLSLSGWSLLVLVKETDIHAIQAAFSVRTPSRFFAIILLLPVLIFLITDLKESLVATVSNTLPPAILNTQLPTNHFAVMDLAFLVPLFLLTANRLWQRRALGYACAGTLLSYYSLELLSIGSDQWFGGTADPQSPLANAALLPPFLTGAAIFLAVLVWFLSNVRAQTQASQPLPSKK